MIELVTFPLLTCVYESKFLGASAFSPICQSQGTFSSSLCSMMALQQSTNAELNLWWPFPIVSHNILQQFLGFKTFIKKEKQNKTSTALIHQELKELHKKSQSVYLRLKILTFEDSCPNKRAIEWQETASLLMNLGKPYILWVPYKAQKVVLHCEVKFQTMVLPQ